MTDQDTGEVRRWRLEGDKRVWISAADHDEAVATLRARVSELEGERDQLNLEVNALIADRPDAPKKTSNE